MAFPRFTGTLPARTQSKSALNTNAESWFRYLKTTFAYGIDSSISEAVALADVEEYDAGTAYSFPDTVIYTDGMTYRCTSSSPVTGEDPSLLVNFVKLTLSEPPRLSVPSGAILTGEIIGGNYRKTAANQIQIDAFAGYDGATNQTAITCAQQYVTIPSAINTTYHLFSCSDGNVRTDTDADGANLSAYTIRWRGPVFTDSNGEIYDCIMNGYDLLFPTNDFVIGTPTADVLFDWSAFVPSSRVLKSSIHIPASPNQYGSHYFYHAKSDGTKGAQAYRISDSTYGASGGAWTTHGTSAFITAGSTDKTTILRALTLKV